MGIFAKLGNAISSSFGALGAKPPTGPTKPNGGDGIQAYGGFLLSDEQRPELAGLRKWTTFSNATNTAIVATGLRRTLDMLAGTKWSCVENEAGGKDAARGVDIVTKGLIKASLPKPWPNVVRKAAMYRYFGFSLHEWTVARNSDGMMIFADIAHRPQYTVDRWDKPSEQEPWKVISQLTRNGNRFVIPRGRLFHCVDDTLTDSPDGVGLMRHIIELVRRLGVLEGLEGLAFETDLRGMPVGRAPIGELAAQATANGALTSGQIQSYIADRTVAIRSSLANMVKSPEQLKYLLLDSAPFLGADQNTFSQGLKWTFDLLKGESNGVDVVGAAIGRLQLEIARVLGIEFAMVGGGSTAGTHGMHKDKTDFFATMLQTTVTELAAFATNDLARVLVGLNGLDPDTACPTLSAEPISSEAVQDTCTALQALAAAGLDPRDPAIPVIRDRMQLPPPPEPTPEMLGLLQGGLGGKRPAMQAPGQPASQVKPGGKPATSAGKAPADAKVESLGAKPDQKPKT